MFHQLKKQRVPIGVRGIRIDVSGPEASPIESKWNRWQSITFLRNIVKIDRPTENSRRGYSLSRRPSAKNALRFNPLVTSTPKPETLVQVSPVYVVYIKCAPVTSDNRNVNYSWGEGNSICGNLLNSDDSRKCKGLTWRGGPHQVDITQ